MNGIYRTFENICDIDTLQTHLSGMAFFIGLYENMVDMIEERVEAFICDDFVLTQNDRLKYKHNDKYRKLIKNRIVDPKNNKDTLKASMLWFVDVGAITQEDYDLFLHLKDRRNSYTHQMSDHILKGLSDDDAHNLVALLGLYKKLDQWWINEVEIPIAGDEVPGNYEREGVMSTAFMTFLMMFQTLYADKSEEYMNIINEVKRGFEEESE